MKHLRVFKGVGPVGACLTLGSNSQGGWRHAGAVDGSNHAKRRAEDGVQHLEERIEACCYWSNKGNQTPKNPFYRFSCIKRGAHSKICPEEL